MNDDAMALPSAPLIDREREQQQLEQLAAAGSPRLALLYGRRRLGKTFLLDRTWAARDVFYFLAADSTPEMNRADLVRDFAVWSGRDLDAADYPSWRTVFRLLAERAQRGPLIVVLDEFQYLLGGDDDAASQLVAVWDREVEGSPLTLVLCGSEVATMERLHAADRPLYGRVDWSHRLQPFDYFDARRMLPRWSVRDAARAYGVFGGTPLYLATIAAGETLPEAACRTMLAPGAAVRIQVENIIEQEKGIRSPAEYRAVLAAIARGCTQRNEIASAAGLTGSQTALRHVLQKLEDLGLVAREQSFAAPRNSPFRYRVADHALRFYYRFVDPNRSALQTGDTREIWELRVVPSLDTYMGGVFEQICRDAFARRHSAWGLAGAAKWAGWEGHDRFRRSIEIDIVARLLGGELLTGEAKWSSTPVGPSLYARHLIHLEALAASGYAWAYEALPDSESARYLYVSAAGFTSDMRALADAEERVTLLDLNDLYGVDDGAR